VRVPDQPTAVHLSASFAALLQALCATALQGGLPVRSNDLADRGRADYAQNRWAAARFGTRGDLLHPGGERFLPASELAAELIELVRPAARLLGGESLLDRIDPTGSEADLQLAHESPQDAAADIAARSLVW
jgi:gamma-glutamyl:cysteine ligase YbdK (ATP-grasp superfamily)